MKRRDGLEVHMVSLGSVDYLGSRKDIAYYKLNFNKFV